MESSKENVDAVTINGDLEGVEIVHRKTNGNGVHMMDLTAVEALEVKIDKKKSIQTISERKCFRWS